MKLLILVNNPDFFLSHRLAVGLAALRAGIEVHVATPEKASVAAIRAHGFRFHPVPMERSRAGLAGEARTLLSILRIYRSLKPDIVHHVTIKPVLYGTLAARLSGIPAICNAVSGLGYVFIARGARSALVRRAVLLAYRALLSHRNMRVIFQNLEDRGMFLGRGIVRESESKLIRGSGADPERFRPSPEPEGIPVVILPARLLRDKGVEEFAAAAKLLRSKGVAARFVLVGDVDPGNPASLTAGDVADWVESGILEAWGFRKDMEAVFRQSHVVCLPSYREGFSKVLIEAAASGRPIVTTDVPGCRDIVREGWNGLLVPARDAEALARALATLLGDREARKRMGANGRQWVLDEFTEERVARDTLDVYRELRPDWRGGQEQAAGPRRDLGLQRAGSAG
jgi:glycosyltransferase involved in cell wall biosynthesis